MTALPFTRQDSCVRVISTVAFSYPGTLVSAMAIPQSVAEVKSAALERDGCIRSCNKLRWERGCLAARHREPRAGLEQSSTGTSSHDDFCFRRLSWFSHSADSRIATAKTLTTEPRRTQREIGELRGEFVPRNIGFLAEGR